MNKIKLITVLLASLTLGACSSSDDDNNGGGGGNAYTETTVSEAPVWQVDWSNNQERPNWTEPEYSAVYENWTILKVQIEETLMPYTSEGDLMALFINGELRGLAGPSVNVGSDQTNNGKFLLKAWGNETGTETVSMTLQYYNQTLKHVFTLSGDISLNSDETTGIDEAFIPQFTLGAAKYPVQKTVTVESLLTKVGLTPTDGNIVSAFVGDECRGTAILSTGASTSLLIYGRSAGESVTLKCYDATGGKLYTIPNAVSM